MNNSQLIESLQYYTEKISKEEKEYNWAKSIQNSKDHIKKNTLRGAIGGAGIGGTLTGAANIMRSMRTPIKGGAKAMLKGTAIGAGKGALVGAGLGAANAAIQKGMAKHKLAKRGNK